MAAAMVALHAQDNEPDSPKAGQAASDPSCDSPSKHHSAASASSIEIQGVWRKVFDRFDKDRSGLLDMREVQEGLEILIGSPIPQDKFEEHMKKFDEDGSGQLDINEFGMLITDLRESRKSYVEAPVKEHEGSIIGQRKLPYQDRVLHIYNNKLVAGFVAACIIGNFFINILEKQIDPDTNNLQYEGFWHYADIVLNIIFLFELLANMWSYGGPVKCFWKSGWNVFDTLIVAVGVLTMANVLGPPLDKLKLMRAFRVFRLFKRVESLNKIIVALMNSIPGVINAFVVMLVFFCIYAILAVELFRDFGEGGSFVTHDSTTGLNYTIDSVSSRGYVHGIEYYGTFMRALYTLFQVMTGESWSEAVARPLLFGLYENDAIVVGCFFVSFIILTQIVLINVVVAVLLEKFVASDPDDGDADTAVDARLQALDGKEASADMSSKLDRLLNNVDILASSVKTLDAKCSRIDELSATVVDLKSQMRVIEKKLPDARVVPPKEEKMQAKSRDMEAINDNMTGADACTPKGGDWAHPWGLRWTPKTPEVGEGEI